MSIQIAALALAAQTFPSAFKRPIRREESILGHHKRRHLDHAAYQMGATRDGKIVAVEGTVVGDVRAAMPIPPLKVM